MLIIYTQMYDKAIYFIIQSLYIFSTLAMKHIFESNVTSMHSMPRLKEDSIWCKERMVIIFSACSDLILGTKTARPMGKNLVHLIVAFRHMTHYVNS